MKYLFIPADILIPAGISMEAWSVIACDQFSSEREYWERVGDNVGRAPSTLRMILPEAYLEDVDEEKEIRKIRAAMEEYINRGYLSEIKNSFIYVERTQPDERMRKGIVGTIDIEEYDFKDTSRPAIRASEGTVLDRLPTRIKVRRGAPLELPHIITFIDDRERTVIEPLADKAESLPLLYDFDLMEGGGRIKGKRVTGSDAEGVLGAINALYTKQTERGTGDMLMVIGDGNHSLAAAKVYWDEFKQTLSEKEREHHPARRALVEVNNVYDDAVSFEAIHRVMFDVDVKQFIKEFEETRPQGSDYTIRWVSRGESGSIGIRADCIGDMLTIMQTFVDDYVERTGCLVDYIHGDDSAVKLAEKDRCLGLLLPAMDKSELFMTVAKKGVFPRKSFSVGHARDKRYYLECRRIKP